MGEVDNTKLLKESQSNVWTLIRGSTAITAYTNNILDGVPLGLTKGIGFPYIIVPTPTITSEKYLTFKRKMVGIAFKVEVFDRKESVSRSICDALRNLLETNKATFHTTDGMFKYMNSSTALTYVTDEDNTVIYNYTLNMSFEVVLW